MTLSLVPAKMTTTTKAISVGMMFSNSVACFVSCTFIVMFLHDPVSILLAVMFILTLGFNALAIWGLLAE